MRTSQYIVPGIEPQRDPLEVPFYAVREHDGVRTALVCVKAWREAIAYLQARIGGDA